MLLSTIIWLYQSIRRNDFVYMKRELFGYFCVCTFWLNPDVLTGFLTHFNWIVVLPLEGTFLSKNRNHECWDKEHTAHAFVAGGGLLVWCIVIPILFLIYSIYSSHKKVINTEEIRRRVGYSIWAFRESRFYWEFIILLRKYAMALFVTNIIITDGTV